MAILCKAAKNSLLGTVHIRQRYEKKIYTNYRFFVTILLARRAKINEPCFIKFRIYLQGFPTELKTHCCLWLERSAHCRYAINFAVLTSTEPDDGKNFLEPDDDNTVILLQGCLSGLKLRGRGVSLVGGKRDPLIDRMENLGECRAHPCAHLRYTVAIQRGNF
jgi:hypothetical protein